MPVRRGRWTAAAAAQARVVARMRERGHSLEDLKRAGREGRLAFGFTEDLFPKEEEQTTVEEVARETGLEPELIERILVILGTPLGQRAPAQPGGRRGAAPLRPGSGRGLPAGRLPAAGPRLRAVDCGGSPTPRSASSTSTCTNR